MSPLMKAKKTQCQGLVIFQILKEREEDAENNRNDQTINEALFDRCAEQHGAPTLPLCLKAARPSVLISGSPQAESGVTFSGGQTPPVACVRPSLPRHAGLPSAFSICVPSASNTGSQTPGNKAAPKNAQNHAAKNITSEAMNSTMP